MPAKKKKAAKGKDAKGGAEEEVCGPSDFSFNYQRACRTLGVPVCEEITRTLSGAEEDVKQLAIPAELGPAGTRALAAGILGRGVGMSKGAYAPLKALRLWRSNVGDAGAAALVRECAMGSR
jgi:hypothetical protein